MAIPQSEDEVASLNLDSAPSVAQVSVPLSPLGYSIDRSNSRAATRSGELKSSSFAVALPDAVSGSIFPPRRPKCYDGAK